MVADQFHDFRSGPDGQFILFSVFHKQLLSAPIPKLKLIFVNSKKLSLIYRFMLSITVLVDDWEIATSTKSNRNLNETRTNHIVSKKILRISPIRSYHFKSHGNLYITSGNSTYSQISCEINESNPILSLLRDRPKSFRIYF